MAYKVEAGNLQDIPTRELIERAELAMPAIGATATFDAFITWRGPLNPDGYDQGEQAILHVEYHVHGTRSWYDPTGLYPFYYDITLEGVPIATDELLRYFSFDWIWDTEKEWDVEDDIALGPMPDHSTHGWLYIKGPDMSILAQAEFYIPHAGEWPEPEGEFLESWFEYFNPRVPIWQDTPPEDVGIGQEIGVNVRYQNTATAPQSMTAHVYIYDPDGIEIGNKKPEPIVIDTGGNYFTALTADTNKLGTYTAEAILYAQGEEVDRWEGAIAVAVLTEIAGEFIENMFLYWNDDAKEWQEQSPTDIAASCVGIYTSGRNTGTGSQMMTTKVIIKDPNGKIIKTEQPDPVLVESIGFVHADVYTYDLTVKGIYTAECQLIADGEVVDTWTGTIAGVKEVVGKPLPMWPFIAGGGGIGGLGGLASRNRAIGIPVGVAVGAGLGYVAYKIYEAFQ